MTPGALGVESGPIRRLTWAGDMRLRRGLNHLLFRWRTRHARPSEEDLAIHRALNYSRHGIRFLEDAAGANPLVHCPLREGDVVLDVGGYTGEWTAEIRSRYEASIHVFEPDPGACESLRERFSEDERVTLHPIGLAATNATASLNIAGMGSSIFSDSPARRAGLGRAEIELRDARGIFDELGLDEVALLKINIEGGEYDLLDRLIACGLQRRCRYIRVQFHEWYLDSHRRRRRIKAALERSHEPEWSYPFIWESWRRKPGLAASG